MKEHMEASFAALQLGITFCGSIAAATGGAFVDEHVAPLLIQSFHLSPNAAKAVAIVLFVIPLSVFTILFAELVPKLFALQNKEWVCLVLSPVMRRLTELFGPIVRGLESIVKAVLSVGQRFVKALSISPESTGLHELQAAVALARTARVIGPREEKIVLAAAQLASRPLRDVILPAADISMIPARSTLIEAMLQAHLDLHTRFPVSSEEGNPQTIVGYLNFKDLVVALKMKPAMPNVEGILRPLKRLPGDLPIAQALEQMMREKIHIALVQNPDGHVLGMVTMEDIVEEMLGDIEDEFDHLPTHFHPAGQGWIMGGGVSMATVYQCLGKVPEGMTPDMGNQRLAEWSAAALGRAVNRGDVIRSQGLEVGVRKLRRRKVSEAYVSRISA
jgi:putative hemolysin